MRAPRDNIGMSSQRAMRVTLRGQVQAVGLRDATVARARELGLLGWVRNGEPGTVLVHAEGDAPALAALAAFLHQGTAKSQVEDVAVEKVRVEGHEQFAIRGVSAGVFVVQEHAVTARDVGRQASSPAGRSPARHFDLRLEVGGVMRSWAVPKGPSLDPAVKRFAVQVEDHGMAHNEFEGPTGRGGVIIWDRGSYEQGGRVRWPEALERGHAVFVLHGEKLGGGFALQRTKSHPPGPKSQWLLIKRRDEHARPGSEVIAERPESVVSGLTLDGLLE
jgi:DNA ligase D-like protein (predicted 3'-phosphoesterase)